MGLVIYQLYERSRVNKIKLTHFNTHHKNLISEDGRRLVFLTIYNKPGSSSVYTGHSVKEV